MDRAERVANELWAETKPREYVNVLRREFQAVWEEAAAVALAKARGE